MEVLRLLSDLFPVPGQQIRPKGTRRRLQDGYYGPMWVFPFFGGAIYSYPSENLIGENDAWKSSIGGLFQFFALSLAVASFSWYDLLIIYLLSFGQDEALARIPDDAWYVPYEPGHGISGIMGWLAGYLVARVISSRRTWACLGGFLLLQGYVSGWWEGLAGISHECHFTTLLEGFIAGVFLEYFGPKPKPLALIKRHPGKFVLVVMVAHLIFSRFLEYIFPNPPGFVDRHDPKNKEKVEQQRREEMDEVGAIVQAEYDAKRRIEHEEREKAYAAESARLEAELREDRAAGARLRAKIAEQAKQNK